MATQAIGRDPERPANHGGAAIVLLGAAALVGVLALKGHGSSSGAPCGTCAATAPGLPNGIYETCSDPAVPNTCTLWYVYNGARYGITTPLQFQRCFAGMPLLGTNVGFGNGDSTDFIGTVQDISAGCPCPPGSTGFGT
jgi:hypothetical protein